MTDNEEHEIGGLAFASYIDAISEESDRLAHAVTQGLEAPVPTCPGWTAADLIAHVTGVYRFFATQLEAADPEASHPPDTARAHQVSGPRGAIEALGALDPFDAFDAFDNEVVRLASTLARVGAASPCWNWSGRDLVSGWVARRMAIETAVHRVDAEGAYGATMPIETELAVDGVDECLQVHLPANLADEPKATLGGSLCLVCSDVDAAWVVDVTGGRLRWRRGRGPADVAIVGRASDLLLFTWNRVELDVLAVTGSHEVADAWKRLPVN